MDTIAVTPISITKLFDDKDVVTYINKDADGADLKILFEECHTLYLFIAMALHIRQQCGGIVMVNHCRVEALVMDQTNGYNVSLQDIFDIDGQYRRLSEILKESTKV
jgi:hypothetical protein